MPRTLDIFIFLTQHFRVTLCNCESVYNCEEIKQTDGLNLLIFFSNFTVSFIFLRPKHNKGKQNLLWNVTKRLIECKEKLFMCGHNKLVFCSLSTCLYKRESYSHEARHIYQSFHEWLDTFIKLSMSGVQLNKYTVTCIKHHAGVKSYC